MKSAGQNVAPAPPRGRRLDERAARVRVPPLARIAKMSLRLASSRIGLRPGLLFSLLASGVLSLLIAPQVSFLLSLLLSWPGSSSGSMRETGVRV